MGEVCGVGLVCRTNGLQRRMSTRWLDAGIGDGGASARADVGATGPCDGQDGHVLLTGDYSAGVFGDDCIETGEQTRTVSVCRDGAEVNEVESQACERDTDGTIVVQSDFGACGGFDDLCDLVGQQARVNTVCRDGSANEEPETQVCERDDPGVVIEANRSVVCMTEAGG